MKKHNLMTVMAPVLALALAGCAAQAPATTAATEAAEAVTEAAAENTTEAAEAATEAAENATEAAEATKETTEAATEAAEATTETAEVAATGKIVAPLPEEVDVTNPADGIYRVEINSVEKKDDGIYADVDIYTTDYYDAVDIATLEPGDTFVLWGEEVLVKTFVESDPVTLTDADGNEGTYALYTVNGGLEEGGFELVADEGGTYRYYGMDDYPSFTEQGTATLKIADDATVTDKAHILDDPTGQLSDEGVSMTAAEFADGYEEESTQHIPYTHYNTFARTESGVIVDLNRIFTP